VSAPKKRIASLSDVEEIKLIYFEVLEGFNFDAETKLFVKHFSDKDSCLILRKREELFRYYSSQGVPHEDDLLKAAIENEEWSQEKEDNILSLKYQISDNEKNIHNIIPEQRGGIERMLEETKVKLAEAVFERKNVLGRSIEDLIDDDVNDYVVYLSFFKDEKLTEPLEPTYELFQNWEPTEVNKLNHRLGFHYRRFSERNLKGVACLPMFVNKLGFSKEDASTFLGRPIFDLTHNQNFIFSYGIRNLNLLSTAKGSPPDLNLDAKMDDVIKWYDLQQSINIGKKNSQG
jgi:hypothetical protein